MPRPALPPGTNGGSPGASLLHHLVVEEAIRFLDFVRPRADVARSAAVPLRATVLTRSVRSTLARRPMGRSPPSLTFAHKSVEACRGGDRCLAAPEGWRAGRSPAPALSEAEWDDRREPWDPAASGPEPRQGRFFRRCLAGCRGANRPLRGLCTGGRPFPGLPSVTLGYGPDASGGARSRSPKAQRRLAGKAEPRAPAPARPHPPSPGAPCHARVVPSQFSHSHRRRHSPHRRACRADPTPDQVWHPPVAATRPPTGSYPTAEHYWRTGPARDQRARASHPGRQIWRGEWPSHSV